MNEQSNAPMTPGSAGVSGWITTWMNAVTKPNEQTFATMAEHPDAMNPNRALTWVLLAGTASAIINGVLQAILELAGLSAQTAGLADLFGGSANRGVAFSVGVAICASPIAGAVGALFFAITVGIIQWVAKMFKGTGTFSQLAYTMAAISVPFTLVSSFLTPFSSIAFVGICTGLISLGLLVYVIVLELMAIKAVNKFGWGQAAGSLFLPGLVLACCIAVVVAALAGMGVAIGDTFNSINQSLP